MNYPTHLQYSKSHEWIRTEDGVRCAIPAFPTLPNTLWATWCS